MDLRALKFEKHMQDRELFIPREKFPKLFQHNRFVLANYSALGPNNRLIADCNMITVCVRTSWRKLLVLKRFCTMILLFLVCRQDSSAISVTKEGGSRRTKKKARPRPDKFFPSWACAMNRVWSVIHTIGTVH